MSQIEEPNPGSDHDDGSLIDVHQLRNYLGFVVHSVSRHRFVVAATFAVTVAGAAVGLRVWPKTYHVEAKLLARRNDLMTSLSNPGRPARPEADDPTRATSEMIHRRDNLFSLVQNANLVNQWARMRSPLGTLRRSLASVLHLSPEEDLTEALIGMLDQRLSVTVDKEGVVKIGIDWPDARTASELVDAALQSYIAMRHDQETSAITEAIGILQNSAASLQGDVDHTIAQLREEQSRRPQVLRARSETKPALKSPTGPAAAPPRTDPSSIVPPSADALISGPSPAVLLQLGRLNAVFEAKKQEIARLEAQQRQQISELQGRLSTALTIYTEDHPTVSSLRQSIASASRESAELAELRAEAHYLETQYAALEKTRDEGTKAILPAAVSVSQPPPSRVETVSTTRSAEPEGTLLAVLPADAARLTDLAHPSSRLLTLQLAQLANLLDRINGARLELATASAGLKYRFNVTQPAEIPKKPIKPNVIAVLAAAALGGLLLALTAAVAIDVLSGLLLEPWQLERVGIPVLATVATASASRADSVWQRLWFSTLQKPWNSLAIEPTDPTVRLGRLAEVIVEVGRQHGEKSVKFLDATAAQLKDVQCVVNSVRQANQHECIVVAVGPIAENPAAPHIVRTTNSVLLVSRLGASALSAVRDTVTEVGRDRVLGSILLT
jgi:uncharacterized protein involved in exopolysaccharide biosynthesis